MVCDHARLLLTILEDGESEVQALTGSVRSQDMVLTDDVFSLCPCGVKGPGDRRGLPWSEPYCTHGGSPLL